ncbi:GIY-YIG nuclease family protein [Thioclava sp.]|uniref:GIY-YIG nuclease family protein n=1 Tax=Thioclava sp. TaxID=1933450 RepID=UPI003AA86E2A
MTQHNPHAPAPKTLIIGDVEYPIYNGTIHAHWADAATAKGYRILARVKNKDHLALECATCGGVHISRHSVVLNANPECPHCIKARWRAKSNAAGLKMLRRDPKHRHYAFYRAPCGHELRRQFTFVERVARGEVAHRCEICLKHREQAEAKAQGWERIGADPKGKDNYRLYRHADGCGATARVARVNMQTGRFTCPGCGESWSTEPSYLYAMRFELKPGKFVIKLGYSRDPESRLQHQLARSRDLPRVLLRKIPMRSGRYAQLMEKRLHKRLERRYPAELVPRHEFINLLKVKSEIYRPNLETVILRELKRLERKEAGPAGRSQMKRRARQARIRKSRH